MESRRSSPLSFQDAQSQAPSSYHTATPQPSIAIDSEDEDPAGFFFDSMVQKLEFFEQQRGILQQLDLEDCSNLAKHLYIAWLLKMKHLDEIHGGRAAVPNVVGGSLTDRDIKMEDVDNAMGMLSPANEQDMAARASKLIDGIPRKNRDFGLFYKKWSAWPFPPELLPEPAAEGPTYALRDALFTVILRQTTLSLHSRKRRYTVSDDDSITMQLCRPVLQEILPRVDHLLITIYRAMQGFIPPNGPKKKNRRWIKVNMRSNKRMKLDASSEEPTIQPPTISRKRKRRIKLLDGQDILNYCALLGWPPEVLQATAKRMSKLLPQGGFGELGYRSIPETAGFPANPPRKWVHWKTEIPPIVIEPGERSVIVAGERVDRTTLSVWQRLDELRDWRSEGGGVTPDGYLECIEERKIRLGGNGEKQERDMLARKARLQRAWEEEHGGA